MNTMINPELPKATREELLERVEEMLTSHELLEAEIRGLKTTLQVADEHLKSYRQQKEQLKQSVEALAHEHLDLEGTGFYDEIVELFDIELTKYVTVQLTVSLEVQAQVPAGMDDDEVAEELTNATLDYSFFGNGDFVIEDWSFGNLEVE
jgi:hypothetical protein